MNDAEIEAVLARLKGDDMLIIVAGRDDLGSVTLTRYLNPPLALRAFRSVLEELRDDAPRGRRDAHTDMIEQCLAILARLGADG